MSTAPAGGGGGGDAPDSKPIQMSNNCWSCRLIPGAGLILSGAYVYTAGRRAMRQGAPASVWTVGQLAFAAGLVTLGLVVMADYHHAGKAPRKT